MCQTDPNPSRRSKPWPEAPCIQCSCYKIIFNIYSNISSNISLAAAPWKHPYTPGKQYFFPRIFVFTFYKLFLFFDMICLRGLFLGVHFIFVWPFFLTAGALRSVINQTFIKRKLLEHQSNLDEEIFIVIIAGNLWYISLFLVVWIRLRGIFRSALSGIWIWSGELLEFIVFALIPFLRKFP